MTADPPLVIEETAEPEAPARRETSARTIGVEPARTELASCLDGLLEQILSSHATSQDGRPEPPHAAIRITAGTGKSEQIRQMTVRFVAEAKRRGLPHRVLVLVPTHRLGNEALGRMPDGVTTSL
jgi:hypothetical protein